VSRAYSSVWSGPGTRLVSYDQIVWASSSNSRYFTNSLERAARTSPDAPTCWMDRDTGQSRPARPRAAAVLDGELAPFGRCVEAGSLIRLSVCVRAIAVEPCRDYSAEVLGRLLTPIFSFSAIKRNRKELAPWRTHMLHANTQALSSKCDESASVR
jgi:hypothetical protein